MPQSTSALTSSGGDPGRGLSRKVWSMDRRRILLVVAVLSRPSARHWSSSTPRVPTPGGEEKFDTVEVLKATPRSSPARDDRGRPAAGKLALEAVRPGLAARRLPDHTDSLAGTVSPGHHLPRRADHLRQVRRPAAVGASSLQIPDDKHRDLGQPDRPGPGRRLRQPRLGGRDLLDRHRRGASKTYHPDAAPAGHRARRSAPRRRCRRPPPTRRVPRRPSSCPGTLLTLSVDQRQARRCCFAPAQRRAGLRSADRTAVSRRVADALSNHRDTLAFK